MRKHTILIAFLVLGLTIIAQEIQHEAVAVNIEVPVRVYKGNNFVDDLTIKDFEIYEDGILQETDISAIFKEMAQATGGLVDSSFNAAAAFKRAVVVSENYYLLYYTPKNYLSDGKFKKIEVKIKGKNYRITHRAGYIAD